MARYLLDTDAIIDYLLGVRTTLSLIQDLYDRGETLCVCDVVIGEMYAGLRPDHREDAGRLLSACAFLPTSVAIAQQAGMWRYDFARHGIPLSTADTLVGATAYGHGAAVVTGNTKDYPMLELTSCPWSAQPEDLVDETRRSATPNGCGGLTATDGSWAMMRP